MPLLIEEIVPGVVAILEAAPIFDDSSLQFNGEKAAFRSGPFVCVQVVEDRSAWLHVTRQLDKRCIRLKLKQEWKLDGSDIWQKEDQYISDARKPYIAANAAFVRAGAKELPHQPHKRPHLSPDGVAAVLAEMEKYGAKAL